MSGPAYLVRSADQIDPICLSIRDTARSLSVGQRSVERYIAEGRLPSVLIDGRRVVMVDDLRQFALAHRIVPAPS